MAIGEEVAHMEQEFFDKIIAPTLSARAIFIGITTLGEDKERNFVNELMEIEDDNGEKLFRTIDLKMVCDRCLRLGKEMQCRHRMGQLPYWQDSKRHNDIQKMLEGRSDTYLLEMRGVQTDKWTRPAFDHAAVERVFSETEEVTYSHSNFIKHIFVAVDPSAGGAKSNYAIISCFYTSTGKVVICGSEAGKYRVPQDCSTLIIQHIQGLRRLPGAESARIIFVPESNLAFEGIWASMEISRSGLQEICIMREDENRAGVKINREFKKIMAMGLNYKLIDACVLIHRDMVCTDDNNTPEAMKAELKTQLMNYSRIIHPSKDPHKAPAESYGGKRGHGFDDNAIALMLNIVMRQRFLMRKEKYREWY